MSNVYSLLLAFTWKLLGNWRYWRRIMIVRLLLQ